jgi:hypothetical protein
MKRLILWQKAPGNKLDLAEFDEKAIAAKQVTHPKVTHSKVKIFQLNLKLAF